MNRERYQLVVRLGEGREGSEKKKALVKAATERGMVLSEWAREVLYAAAAIESKAPVEQRLTRLEERVEQLWNMQRL